MQVNSIFKYVILVSFALVNIQCCSYYYYFNGWAIPDGKLEDFTEYKDGLKSNTHNLVDFKDITRSTDIDAKVDRIAFDSFAEHTEGLVKVEHTLLDCTQTFIPVNKLNEDERRQFRKLKQVGVSDGR